jgi:hypothetical protein
MRGIIKACSNEGRRNRRKGAINGRKQLATILTFEFNYGVSVKPKKQNK